MSPTGSMTQLKASKRVFMVGASAVLALSLAACSSTEATDEATAEQSTSSAGYPMTVQTASGPVTIPADPTRVLAIGVPVAEELLSVGVTPLKVAVDPTTLKEYTPWIADKIAGIADGGLLQKDYTLNIEAIAAAKPDLIIGDSYTLSQKGVASQLNAIAPTISTVSADANVDWDERLLKTAEAVNKTPEAEAIITKIKADYAAIGAKVPDIGSKTYQWVRVDPDGYGFGNGSMFELFGLKPAANQQNDQNDNPVLSKENTSQLDADLLAVFPPTADLRKAIDKDPLFQALPSVKNGTVYYADWPFAFAINGPAPYALEWLKDKLAPTIEKLANVS